MQKEGKDKEDSLDRVLEHQETFEDFLVQTDSVKNFDSLVLRTNLFCEYFVDRAMEDIFEKASIIHEKNYYLKLDLIEAQEYYSENLLSNIKKINQIRNKISHSLNYRKDEDVLNAIKSKISEMNIMESRESIKQEKISGENFEQEFRKKAKSTMKWVKYSNYPEVEVMDEFDPKNY